MMPPFYILIRERAEPYWHNESNLHAHPEPFKTALDMLAARECLFADAMDRTFGIEAESPEDAVKTALTRLRGQATS